MKDFKETAHKFWSSQKKYPKFVSRRVKKLRLEWDMHFIEKTIPDIPSNISLIDIGCGTGEVLEELIKRNIADKYYGCDINFEFLKNINKGVETFTQDIENPKRKYPKTDIAIVGGVIQYIKDDKKVVKFLKEINSNLILVRSVINTVDLEVCKYSKILKSEYASFYRSFFHTLSLLSEVFDVISYKRAYPDSLESKFNTEQYWFICKRKRKK